MSRLPASPLPRVLTLGVSAVVHLVALAALPAKEDPPLRVSVLDEASFDAAGVPLPGEAGGGSPEGAADGEGEGLGEPRPAADRATAAADLRAAAARVRSAQLPKEAATDPPRILRPRTRIRPPPPLDSLAAAEAAEPGSRVAVRPAGSRPVGAPERRRHRREHDPRGDAEVRPPEIAAARQAATEPLRPSGAGAQGTGRGAPREEPRSAGRGTGGTSLAPSGPEAQAGDGRLPGNSPEGADALSDARPPSVEAEPEAPPAAREGQAAAAAPLPTAAARNDVAGDEGGRATEKRSRDGAVRWLRYVRTDGRRAAAAPADARYIGGRNVVVPRQTAAPTHTLRSFGDGEVVGDALVGKSETGVAPVATPGFRDGLVERSALGTGAEGEADAPAPRGPTSLRLAMLPEDPGPGGSRPAKERRAVRAKLPRPTPEAPARATDGEEAQASVAAPEAASGSTDAAPRAEPPAFDDAFWAAPAPAAPANPVEKEGSAWSSLEVVDELPEAEAAAVSVAQTPLGVWMDGVDSVLRGRTEYPLELRALGAGGRVSVRFVVRADGSVREVRVTRASGHPELDRAALAAIPSRVEPPPAPTRRVPVSYTFRFGDR